jgi:hypothetical protein
MATYNPNAPFREDTCVYGGLLLKANKIMGNGETFETHVDTCRKCFIAWCIDVGLDWEWIDWRMKGLMRCR